MFKKELKNPFLLFSTMAFSYVFFTLLHAVLRIILLGNNLCDFRRFYLASRLLSQGGNLYQMDVAYHPLFFYSFRVFSFLPERLASFAWVTFLILLALVCVKLAADFIKSNGQEIAGIPTILLCGFIAFSFSPLLEDLAVGQANVLLLFLFMALLVAQAQKTWIRALALSLMIILKLQFGIFFLFFLWKKQYRVVIGGLVLYAVWTLLAATAGGYGIINDYLNKILFFLGPQNRSEFLAKQYFFYPCIFMALARVFFNSGILSMAAVKVVYAVISLGLLGLTFTRYITRTAAQGLRYAYELILVALLMLLICPFTEEHHLVILIPAFCIMFFEVLKNGDSVEWMMYITGFLLIGLTYSLNSFPAFNSGFLGLFSMGKLFGIIILFFLQLRILGGKKQDSGI